MTGTVTSGNRTNCELDPPTPLDLSVRLSPSQLIDNEGMKQVGGVVEVYTQGAWHGVCQDDQFDLQDADVLCKQLGLSSALRTTTPTNRYCAFGDKAKKEYGLLSLLLPLLLLLLLLLLLSSQLTLNSSLIVLFWDRVPHLRVSVCVHPS